MDISIIIIALGLLVLFSHVFSALFSKTKVPSVLLLMLIGLVVGPILHLIGPEQLGRAGNVFTTVTLICILFESGTGLNMEMMRKSIGGASMITFLNFICMLVICGLIGRLLLGLDWMHSFYLGAAIGGTSSAIVIPMLGELKPGPKASAVLLLESTLSDVFCLAVALALMSGIESDDLSFGDAALGMTISVLFAILIGLAVGVVWLIVLRKYLKRLPNSMFTSFALAFVLYGLCDIFGWNGGLAVLSYGIVLGNLGGSARFRRWFRLEERTQMNSKERNFFSEIVFVLKTYFFVYIGICIQLKNPWHLMIGAVIVALAFASRTLVTATLGRKDMDSRDIRLISSLGAKGLIAAVLATVPLQNALNHSDRVGLDAEVVEDAVTVMLEDGKPFVRVPKTTMMRYEAELMVNSDGVKVAELDTVDEVLDKVYAGKTVRNVAYAVVLLSIILCSLMVILGENRKDEETAEGEGGAPEDALTNPGQA